MAPSVQIAIVVCTTILIMFFMSNWKGDKK
jgi:hypothetical protein